MLARIAALTLLVLCVVAPVAQADEPPSDNPSPGQRLCYLYSDGGQGPCSNFPAARYIYLDTDHAPSSPYESETIRVYQFEDGTSISMFYPSQNLVAPLVNSSYGPWGWKDTTLSRMRAWHEPKDIRLLGNKGEIYNCGFIFRKKVRYAVYETRSSCRQSNSIVARILGGTKTQGWKCRKQSCVQNRKYIVYKIVAKGSTAADTDKNSLARYCGDYEMSGRYQVYAHNCADASDEFLGYWQQILSGQSPHSRYPCGFNVDKHTMRCSADHGCVILTRTSIEDLGFIGYGQTWLTIPRDKCTQID